MNLNRRALALADAIAERAALLRVAPTTIGKSRVIDCGVQERGGVEAGRLLAEVCLAGLGHVAITAGNPAVWDGPAVTVHTDHPVPACMASQYAGWAVQVEKYFAMGSGPMRAAAAREPLFDEPALAYIKQHEQPSECVGVLETSELPSEPVCRDIAEKCGIAAENLTLLAAPTNSQAGAVQVVARTVETAMHKLHEIGFDLTRVESGWGVAPLPPVAGDPLGGIGRTNDAVLYGGHAVLYVRGDDESIASVGPQTPSSASKDHGRPFGEIFKSYDHDFYKIDKLLFSPAVITFVNLDTGVTRRFGDYDRSVLATSFQ